MAVMKPINRPQKPEAPEYIVTPRMVVPVENIGHITYPDDHVHIRMKNGETLKFASTPEEWDRLRMSFVLGLGVEKENENSGGGQK